MYPGGGGVERAFDPLTKMVSASVQEVKGLRKRVDKAELKADKIDIRLGKVKGLRKRVDRVELKADKIDISLGKVEGRMDSIDLRLKCLEGPVREVERGHHPHIFLSAIVREKLCLRCGIPVSQLIDDEVPGVVFFGSEDSRLRLKQKLSEDTPLRLKLKGDNSSEGEIN